MTSTDSDYILYTVDTELYHLLKVVEGVILAFYVQCCLTIENYPEKNQPAVVRIIYILYALGSCKTQDETLSFSQLNDN